MSTNSTPVTGNLSTEKVTVRTYVKYGADGLIAEKRTQAQTKDGKNWEQNEKDGFILFNENEVIRYTVKDLEAAQMLIPDEKQLVYILQSGLNYLQNAKANAACSEIAENTNVKVGDNTVPAEPAYNGEEIDLREAINTPPQRTSQSPLEKLEKLLAGFDPETRAMLLKQAAHSMAVQAASEQEAQLTSELS